MASDPGNCPSCDLPLMLTGELRAYSGDDLKAEVERQRVLAEQRSEPRSSSPRTPTSSGSSRLGRLRTDAYSAPL